MPSHNLIWILIVAACLWVIVILLWRADIRSHRATPEEDRKAELTAEDTVW